MVTAPTKPTSGADVTSGITVSALWRATLRTEAHFAHAVTTLKRFSTPGSGHLMRKVSVSG
jgi:hypothetical protein